MRQYPSTQDNFPNYFLRFCRILHCLLLCLAYYSSCTLHIALKITSCTFLVTLSTGSNYPDIHCMYSVQS